jgi:hypothetical protein
MRFTAAIAAIASIFLSAPSWGQSSGAAATAHSSDKPLLKGSFVYVYSFMDVREAEFGPQILNQLDSQLLAELDADGVRAKILRFKQSAVGQAYSQEEAITHAAPFEYHSPGSDLVPVSKTIAANAPDEAATGAGFRLIEFPSSFSTQGAWRYYGVRWDLIDATSGLRIWSRVYNGSHPVLFKNDEDAQSRAKAMLAAVIGDFKRAGFL